MSYVDIFPYKIKNVNNFYFRDHPKNLHPDSDKYKGYWWKQIRDMIEGKWVNDEGTWVYMPAKLYFYINYAKIANHKRRMISPDLRDNEWIIFTYLLCCQGFSGFEFEEEYTSHRLVKYLEHISAEKEKGNEIPELDEVVLATIPNSARKADGTYKKYMDAWEYLTRHYLFKNETGKPLGKCLYENPINNFCLLSARSIGKSVSCFVGDFAHEFLTAGYTSMDELANSEEGFNVRMTFAMTSGDSRPLKRSINNLKAFYYAMPGRYKYKSPDTPPYGGPLYKNLQGSWTVGKELSHTVKNRDGSGDITGSLIQMIPVSTENVNVVAGDRIRRIYCEEFGFLKKAKEFHAANSDSLKSTGKRVGMAVYLGTSGELSTIRGPKALFENPEAYHIYGIPNYWGNTSKNIGLFLPKYYAMSDYKDENGNTRLDLAYNSCLAERKKDKETKDSLSYNKEVMFNPLTPSEMLRPSGASILPKAEAAIQINNINDYDLYKKKATIGSLVLDVEARYGIRFNADLKKELHPILEHGNEDQLPNKYGAFIQYEAPPEIIPNGLYTVLYDPAAQSGDGTSLHSVLVYKGFYRGNEESLYDTVVAEWCGRLENLGLNWAQVIKIAKYFNATVFPETNTPGFVDWCIKEGHAHRLEGEAGLLERGIKKGKWRPSYHGVGVYMNEAKKAYGLNKLRDWLLTTKECDPVTGKVLVRTIDWIFSPRILNEIIAYEKDGNFDHISSLICLMILLGEKEELAEGEVELIEEVDIYEQYMKLQYAPTPAKKRVRTRSKFNQY